MVAYILSAMNLTINAYISSQITNSLTTLLQINADNIAVRIARKSIVAANKMNIMRLKSVEMGKKFRTARITHCLGAVTVLSVCVWAGATIHNEEGMAYSSVYSAFAVYGIVMLSVYVSFTMYL